MQNVEKAAARTSIASGTLAVSPAWTTGAAVSAAGAQSCAVVFDYALVGGSTTGYPEVELQVSPDGTTWRPYMMLDTAYAVASDGVTAAMTARPVRFTLPAGETGGHVPGIDLREAQFVRLRAREAGDAANPGTFAGAIAGCT